MRKLRGVKPSDQAYDDVRQDACLYILERWNTGERKESHLVQYAWGRLKDRHALLFEHNAHTKTETVRLSAVRASRRSDEGIALRGSHGLTALNPLVPEARIAPADQADARIDLAKAIAGLPEAMREVVTAVLVEGKTHAAVAAERGCTRHNVTQILSRARGRLRKALKDYE